MSDELTTINRAIEEHRTIRGHVKLVGDSVSDLEALFALQKARPDWILSQLDALSQKQDKLRQTLSYLDEGLRNHFAFEEKALPPLLGKLLMRALALEHRAIKKRLDEAKSTVADAKLERRSQKELLSLKSHIQQLVDGILQSVEEHAAKEETILKMLRSAVEAKG